VVRGLVSACRICERRVFFWEVFFAEDSGRTEMNEILKYNQFVFAVWGSRM